MFETKNTMKHKVTSFIITTIVILSALISGCSNNNAKPKITHIPVQLKSEGNWSMVDVETGKIFYEGEFKFEPSIASEGIFITKNKEGEIFYNKIIDDQKYEQIAGPFVSGNLMKNNIAIVCKSESYPIAINAKGEEVFNLEPKDGIKFAAVGQCFDGKIKFKSEDGLWGFLNKKGEVVIEPKFDFVDDFNNGVARATMHTEKKDKFVLIDDNGEVMTEIDKPFVCAPDNGKMVYIEDKKEFGILTANKDLEKVISASSKYEGICVKGDDIFYSTDDDWGLMDEKGNSSIRPKYKMLTRLTSDVLLGIKRDGEDFEYHLLDNKGEIQKKEELDGGILGIFNLNNGNFLRKDGKEFQIINSKGEIVGDASFKNWSGLSEITSLNSNMSYVVESEYFDWTKIENFISSMKSGAVSNFKLGMNCVLADTEMKKFENTESDKKEANQGKGMRFEDHFVNYDDYNGNFAYFIGTGFGEKNSDGEDDDVMAAPADTAAAPADDYSSSNNSENAIKDDAPDWSTYQSTLSGNLDLGKSGYVNVNIGFDDYIKKAVIQMVPVNYGYYEYTEQHVVGYQKNNEAKLYNIYSSFYVNDKQLKKLSKMLDSHFSKKGFSFVGEINGWKKYYDAQGNSWEVNGREVRLSRSNPADSYYGDAATAAH